MGFISLYAIICLGIFFLGLGYKFLLFGYFHLTMKSEMIERTKTLYPTDNDSNRSRALKAFWEVIIDPVIFWFKGNPVVAAGHILYHMGLYLAISTYIVAAIKVFSVYKIFTMPSMEALSLIFVKIGQLSIDKAVTLVFGWFHHTPEVFGIAGFWGSVGTVMAPIFVLALALAFVGMLIPFAISALGKKGMIIDGKYVKGLPRKSAGYQRKIIGLLVLIMDGMALFTSLVAVPLWFASVSHVVFALTIMALIPTTFLFHEVYVGGTWNAFWRRYNNKT